MCYQPLTIHNPKKLLNSILDRSLLEVPCGCCKECYDARRNGFFIRMYYEYLDCLNKHGFAYFLTLTYRPSSINTLPTGELCYRHDDVKNYLKLIRIHLERDFGFDVKDNIRYFCCSEFGEERHRPHYHIIFYVTPPIPIRAFIYVARKYWAHGFTKPGKYNNGVVQDVSAFSYVSKYCTKGDKDCETYQHLMRVVDKYDDTKYTEAELRSYRYNCRPVIRSSVNFGLYLLSETDYDMLEKGVIQMPDKKYTVKDYPLPLYYDRKVFYDIVMVDGQPCYRLNEDGFKMKLVRFQHYKECFYKSYQLVTHTHFSPTLFQSVNKQFNMEFTSNIDMMNFFRTSHCDNWENLFNYSLVYNGYASSSFGCSDDGIVTTAFDDFSIRLRLTLGMPVSEDELSSLNLNSTFYKSGYGTALKLLRYLHRICNQTKISDFFECEGVRHRLTSVYYHQHVYNQSEKLYNQEIDNMYQLEIENL